MVGVHSITEYLTIHQNLLFVNDCRIIYNEQMVRAYAKQLIETIDDGATVFLWVAIAFASAVWIGITFWKYAHFLYNGLDLAIYVQVVWNTSHARWFQMSIHPQSYIGDHLEPYLLVLAALYRLWSDPRLLLIVQTVVINVAAAPIFFLARNIFRASKTIRWPNILALMIALSYLLNPLAGNALVFEFHMLPFLVLPLSLALMFAEQGRFWPTMLALAATAFVREDASLMVALVGAVAALCFPAVKRDHPWRWVIWPFVMSIVWFLFGMWMVSQFSPTHDYKFIGFYTQLHGSLLSTIIALLQNPWPLLQNLTRLSNLFTIIGMLIPVAFIAVGAPSALLFAAPSFLQYAVAQAESTQLLVLHYGVIFLPAIMLATILALEKFSRISLFPKLCERWGLPRHWLWHLALIALLPSAIYSTAAIGQVKTLDQNNGRGSAAGADESAMSHALDLVRGRERIAATTSLMPNVTARQYVYPFIYIRRGTQQLSDVPYVVPGNIDAMIVGQEDLWHTILMWKDSTVVTTPDEEAANHVATFVAEKKLAPAWMENSVVVFLPTSEVKNLVSLVSIEKTTDGNGTALTNGITTTATATSIDANTFAFDIHWHIQAPPTKNLIMLVEWLDAKGHVLGREPMDANWGMRTMADWQSGSTVTTHFVLTKLTGTTTMRLSLHAADDLVLSPENLPQTPSLLVSVP